MEMNSPLYSDDQLSKALDQVIGVLLDRMRTQLSSSYSDHLDVIGLMLWLRVQPEQTESNPYRIWANLKGARAGEFKQAFEQSLKTTLEVNPKMEAPVAHLVDSIEDKVPEHMLSFIVEAISGLPLPTRESARKVVGDSLRRAYGLGRMRDLSNISPRPLSKLMVELGMPKPGEWIHDPFAGLCGFLAEAAEWSAPSRESVAPGQSIRISGKEISARAWARACLLLSIEGVEAEVTLGSSFAFDEEPLRPDLILSEPPWGLSGQESGKDRPFYAFLPPDLPASVARDFSGVFLILKLLEPTKGRAVVVLSQRLIFGGGAVARTRQRWLEEDLIEAVITLPKGLFLPATAHGAGLIIFNLNKPTARKGKVLLVSGDRIGIGNDNRFSPEIFEREVGAIAIEYRTFGDQYMDPLIESVVVSLEELSQHDWDLSPLRYLDIDIDGPQISVLEATLAMAELTEGRVEDASRKFFETANQLFVALEGHAPPVTIVLPERQPNTPAQPPRKNRDPESL